MTEWIKEYVSQINMIDEFFIDKFNEYVNQFIDLQAKYMRKIQYENEQKLEE